MYTFSYYMSSLETTHEADEIVSGSGKSSLFRDVFAKEYAKCVIIVDQSSITVMNRYRINTMKKYYRYFKNDSRRGSSVIFC